MTIQQGGIASPTSGAVIQPQAQQFQNFGRSSQPQHHNTGAFQQQPTNGSRQAQRSAPSPAFTNSSSGMSNMAHGSQHSMGQTMQSGSNGGNVAQSASTFYPSPFQKPFEQLGKMTHVVRT
jgi:hypothetical protein